MNSWKIIKQHFIRDTRSATVGRSRELNSAADLFVDLLDNESFSDQDAAKNAFNADDEVGEALLARKGLSELKKAGILR